MGLEKASEALTACQGIFENDFFLHAHKDEFLNESRLLMFETIARVYKSISIDTICRYLSIPVEEKEPERNLVEYMRTVRVDAKIDSEENLLVMNTNYPSIYQQVIDKTKSLPYRSRQMFTAVEKKFATKAELDD